MRLNAKIVIPIIINPTIRKGGKHPKGKRNGKIRLPISAPSRPNIIAKDTVIALT